MHMFAGMALAAVVALLVIFILYLLLCKILTTSIIWLADALVSVSILVAGIALIATGAVHLILMGIFLIAFGFMVLMTLRKWRAAKSTRIAAEEYVMCSKCRKHYHKASNACPYC